jgi:hypothetical protein
MTTVGVPGTPGTDTTTTALFAESVEPTALVAVTLNRYDRPATRPVRRQERLLVITQRSGGVIESVPVEVSV